MRVTRRQRGARTRQAALDHKPKAAAKGAQVTVPFFTPVVDGFGEDNVALSEDSLPVTHLPAPPASLGLEALRGVHALGLTKIFGPLRALDGVDLSVEPGKVVALLGSNGAGKSTLIRCVATSIVPDAGTLSVDGIDVVAQPRQARSRVGLVLTDERSFFWRLSGRHNLEFFCALHGMTRAESAERSMEALASVGLEEVADRRVDRYSSGMRGRLAIARALLGRPSALLLDEPTRSLDPSSSLGVRKLVSELASGEQTAILIATHDLHEASALADEVVILERGRVAMRIKGNQDAASLEAAMLEATALETAL